MTQTYWSNNRNPAEVDYLSAQVPAEGAIDDKQRPWLEAWRCFTNGYYDLFNNGWCNWDMVGAEFVAACNKVDFLFVKSYLINRDDEFIREGSRQWRRLELAGDAILHKAVFECAVLGAYQAQPESPVDWATAPEMMQWAAMDKCGAWYWHEEEPFLSTTDKHNNDWLCSGKMKGFNVKPFQGDWRNSLEKRPEE